jgi:hypothetical protein
MPVLRPGSHQLAFTNAHLPDHSVYLANALVPENPQTSVTAQHRSHDQRALTIDFTQGAPPARAARAPLMATLAVATAVCIPLARRRRR